MRFEQQLRTFLLILREFGNDMPLAGFLRKYFRLNRKMGSSDRRNAGKLLYNYFRLGRACQDLPVEERLFLAQFLCSTQDDPFLNHFKPELNQKASLSLPEKISWLEAGYPGFRLADVFPFGDHLSEGIDARAFLSSFFIQPDLFIRLNPANAELVKKKLDSAEIAYKTEEGNALRLPNGTKLDTLFPDDTEPFFEVQDLSSQKTGKLYRPQKYDYWWDACAGSGGKSLLLFQQEPDIKLLVSDLRENILENLDERFSKAGIRKFQKKQLDLTKNPDPEIHDYQFDGILLDVPCSGSGTWGRTPEMITQFREPAIADFQKLQQSVAANVVKYLKPGKPLIYITCSVFREENEQMAEFIAKKSGLTVESASVLKGYENKADTMFAARLVSPS